MEVEFSKQIPQGRIAVVADTLGAVFNLTATNANA
jgi:hypothetical protein